MMFVMFNERKIYKMKVVLMYSEVLKTWGIVHACSYQKAFRPSFDTEQAARNFATKQGCIIEATIFA